jgi:hypothetical protein
MVQGIFESLGGGYQTLGRFSAQRKRRNCFFKTPCVAKGLNSHHAVARLNS